MHLWQKSSTRSNQGDRDEPLPLPAAAGRGRSADWHLTELLHLLKRQVVAFNVTQLPREGCDRSVSVKQRCVCTPQGCKQKAGHREGDDEVSSEQQHE